MLRHNPTTGAELRLCLDHARKHDLGVGFPTKEGRCIHSTPIVWVECCRIWPVVPGYRVGTCGICGTVPVPCVGGSSIARNVAAGRCENCGGTLSQHQAWAGCDPTQEDADELRD